MGHGKIYKLTVVALLVAIVLTSSLFLIRSIKDADFFWHLKTGEWILQNGSIPLEDIFAHTSPETYTKWERFTLSSYWLGQVIYALFYLAGGMGGIVVLRFIIAFIVMYVMLKRNQRDLIFYLGLLMIFMVGLLSLFPLERPHAFSFLFFVILIYIFEKLKEGESLYQGNAVYFLFPFIMLVWANLHGGYILGLGLILLFILCEGLKFLHPSLRPLDKKVYNKLLIAGMLGIVFSLVNPNFYTAIPWMLRPEHVYLRRAILEYRSVLWTFMQLNDYRTLSYFFILILAMISLAVNIKRIDLTEIVILGVTGYFSFTTIRYIPFFIIVALPVAGRLLSGGNILKAGRIFICVLACSAAVFFGWKERLNIELVSSGKWINTYEYPVAAADFIRQNKIRGNMYNNLEWGGYLIWRLAPETKVFIDGRTLFVDVVETSKLLRNAPAEIVSGESYWKNIFSRYNVTYAIIPLISPSGEFSQLLMPILKDRNWIPVYLDSNAMIFLKNIPEYYPVLRYYSVPKNLFVMALINQYTSITEVRPDLIQAQLAVSDLYTAIERYSEARDSYRKVLRVAPFNTHAAKRLEILDKMLNKQPNVTP